jgi:hypothetical protein
MFQPYNHYEQPPLPFACPSCLHYGTGRCQGPVSYETYTMRGPSLISCVDIERRQELFNDLYSQVIPIPASSHQTKINLPAFIPGVEEGMPGVPAFPPNSLFAVSLETFLRKRGTILFESADELREKLHLPSDARLALIGTGKDRRIERFWTTSDKHDVWRRIAEFGFEFVTSLTFSVYDEQPRADQIYNQDRNCLTHDLFARLHVPSIPFLYPYNEEDYSAVFTWLRERPDISKIAVLAQFYRSDRQFSQFLRNMRLIQDGAGRSVQFLVVGVALRHRIEAIMRDFDASIVSVKPFQAALHGEMILDDLKASTAGEQELSQSRPKLVVQNVTTFTSICEEMRDKYRR